MEYEWLRRGLGLTYLEAIMYCGWANRNTNQRRARIGSHMPKKERNRNGKRYYKGGGYH
jgi:hypothetical protein